MMLRDFVKFIPELYGPKEGTLNSHMLIHLAAHARIWGPLWTFSAFDYEHKNGYLMGHVHSPHKVAEQIQFSLQLNQTIDSLHKRKSSRIVMCCHFWAYSPQTTPQTRPVKNCLMAPILWEM